MLTGSYKHQKELLFLPALNIHLQLENKHVNLFQATVVVVSQPHSATFNTFTYQTHGNQ